MSNNQMLNNVQHSNLKIQTDRAAKFGDDVMFCMTYPFEFRLALAHYPIVMYQQPDSKFIFPVTLFGFAEGENLFLTEQGWDASYVPIMIQRQPFLIGFQKSSRDAERQQVVTVNVDHPRVNKDHGELIFNEKGSYTEYLEKIVKMLESIDTGQEQNKLLSEVLTKYDLLEPTTFEITLKDHSNYQLVGFSMVSEDRFTKLNAAALEDINQKGLLIPITMMMASLSQMRALIERRNNLLG